MTLRLDPRAKLYLLLLANLLLLFHVGTAAEAATTALFLLPFFFTGKAAAGLRLSALYFGLLAVDFFVVPRAGEGVLLNFLSLVSVGIRMMLPCIITGAYAFTTTTVGELTAALRRMHLPESVIIPCAVVVRFFPTVGEDYRHIRAAMALRGIAEGRGALLRHPVQSLEYILMPLLMNSNNVAQDLSAAALTKGIGLPGRHTCLTELHLTALDFVYPALCTLPILGKVVGLL
ncbi:energy-coupling factor transporter transmembrane component T family protein [Gemmiger sp.]